VVEPDQAAEVTGDAEVPVMPLEHPAQPLVLHREWPVHHSPALVGERRERARIAFLGRELTHDTLAVPRASPKVQEPEEDKRRRQYLHRSIRAIADRTEVHQPALLGMQLQPEPLQPLAQHCQHALGVGSVRKEHHHVVAEAN
jgi:hypothetical protein